MAAHVTPPPPVSWLLPHPPCRHSRTLAGRSACAPLVSSATERQEDRHDDLPDRRTRHCRVRVLAPPARRRRRRGRAARRTVPALPHPLGRRPREHLHAVFRSL